MLSDECRIRFGSRFGVWRFRREIFFFAFLLLAAKRSADGSWSVIDSLRANLITDQQSINKLTNSRIAAFLDFRRRKIAQNDPKTKKESVIFASRPSPFRSMWSYTHISHILHIFADCKRNRKLLRRLNLMKKNSIFIRFLSQSIAKSSVGIIHRSGGMSAACRR